MKVTIPACSNHYGIYKIEVDVEWVCPVCGKPRGEIKKVKSYDGCRWMIVDGWENPCGHVDLYSTVRYEAIKNADKVKR